MSDEIEDPNHLVYADAFGGGTVPNLKAADETEDPIKPRWTDLIGIDPDYTDGRPVDEWLEANRANPHHLTPAENDISWAGLMELLDEHWPADLFPTLEDDPKRDAGARIVSLLRWVDRDRAALARVEAVCATAIRVRTERMVEGSLVHIAAKDAIDTFAEAIREAAMVDADAPWLGRPPYRDDPDNQPSTYSIPTVDNPKEAAQVIARRATISDHIKDAEWADEMAHLRRTVLFLSLAGICAAGAISMFVWWAMS
jgi:hypothetical protein